MKSFMTILFGLSSIIFVNIPTSAKALSCDDLDKLCQNAIKDSRKVCADKVMFKKDPKPCQRSRAAATKACETARICREDVIFELSVEHSIVEGFLGDLTNEVYDLLE